MSEHFFVIMICSKLKIQQVWTYKKGFPAVCCIPNPTNGLVAREKAMESDMFGERGGEMSECIF